MPSTFRIPRAHVTGLYGRLMTAYARRTWGQVPDNAYVLWHHRPVLRSVLAFERSLAKWNRLDRHLKTYAVLASACVIECSWCLDFGYFLAHTEGWTSPRCARCRAGESRRCSRGWSVTSWSTPRP